MKTGVSSLKDQTKVLLKKMLIPKECAARLDSVDELPRQNLQKD